jgi:NADP-dependent 3-hydroxy acid dehydrogenase YdfG
MATSWGNFSPEERQQSEPNEAPATQIILAPEQVAGFIAWFMASPPEFVLTEGIILPIEEGLP